MSPGQQVKITHKLVEKSDFEFYFQKIRQELQQLQQSEGGANHVLRVVVENRQYPVTLDDLHRIFSKFGYVKKIITFTKNGKKHRWCESYGFLRSGLTTKSLVLIDFLQ